MRRAVVCLYAAVTVVLAAVTFTDDGGVGAASRWWFVALWTLMAAALVWVMAVTRMWRDAGRMILHTSLVLMLLGGGTTWLTRETRKVTLTAGVAADAGLGSPVTLDSFVTVSYPGAVAPRDYRSYLTVGERHVTVAVNRPAMVDGRTLRQDSYDSLGRSTIEVSKDTAGVPLSYAGYALFVIGSALLLADPRGRFRRLLSGAAVLILPLLCCANPVPGVSRAEADAMKRRQVLWNGRVAPMNTAATELCRKLSDTTAPGGATAEQVVASMLLYPEEWSNRRLLKTGSRRLADSLGIEGTYVSVADLFGPDGSYRLRQLYGIDPALDKAVLALDEKMEIVGLLQAGRLIRPVPEGMALLPGWRVEAELIYNRVPFARVFFPVALVTGLLAMTGRVRKAVRIAAWLLVMWQTAGWVLRWIIGGSVPLGSGGETMMFLSVVLMAVTLVVLRREPLLTGGGILASGFSGLVAWLSLRDPAVTPLMPVLHSPWLSVHVSLVMTAYALLALASVSAFAGLIVKGRGSAMQRTAMLLLYPAMLLLGAGIFTGAVWAQLSWGRYWAWDPKETWALVTLMVYAAALHRSTGILKSPRRFNAYTAVAFLTVLMTYFGVNYLPSLHAYQ